MNWTTICKQATWAVCATAALVSHAWANAVQWTVDSTQSHIEMTIPDLVDPSTLVTVRIRNEDGTAWTTNVAQLGGSVLTNYSESTGQIEFLTNPVGQLMALNSGDYRPNPSSFDPLLTTAANPHGQYTDTSTAPGAYGGRVMIPLSAPPSTSNSYFNFHDLSFDMLSGPLAINPGGEFVVSSMSLGIVDGVAAIDGTPVPLGPQLLPDVLMPMPQVFDTNSSLGLASITSPDPINNPWLRRLEIPVLVFSAINDIPIFDPVSLEFTTGSLDTTLSGTIVAYAMVPEPSTLALAVIGLAGLLWHARRRAQR